MLRISSGVNSTVAARGCIPRREDDHSEGGQSSVTNGHKILWTPSMIRAEGQILPLAGGGFNVGTYV